MDAEFSSLSPIAKPKWRERGFATKRGWGGRAAPAERNLPMDRECTIPPGSMSQTKYRMPIFRRYECMFQLRTGEYAGAFWVRFFANPTSGTGAILHGLQVASEYWVGPVDGWRLMFGEAFRSESFRLVIAKGHHACRKRGICGEPALAGRCANGPFSNSCAHSTAMFGGRFAFAAEGPSEYVVRRCHEPESFFIDISSLSNSA